MFKSCFKIWIYQISKKANFQYFCSTAHFYDNFYDISLLVKYQTRQLNLQSSLSAVNARGQSISAPTAHWPRAKKRQETYQCIEWLCWLHSNQRWYTCSSRHIHTHTRTLTRGAHSMRCKWFTDIEAGKSGGAHAQRNLITSPNHRPLSIQISAGPSSCN